MGRVTVNKVALQTLRKGLKGADNIKTTTGWFPDRGRG